MTTPKVSVVTAVYNGALHLADSLASISNQRCVEFEFLVVDDGSTDGSKTIIERFAAKDDRVRPIYQETNIGLTRSLISACAQARGEYIARHDADDLSLAGRLATQVELLDSNPSLVMASCWVRSVGPGNELLFETRLSDDPAVATELLTEEGCSPCHGSVMFRADAYRKVGGYRPQFRFAQDWDLWLRLAELGDLAYVQNLMYSYRVHENAISTHRQSQQRQLADLARRCFWTRLKGESEDVMLKYAKTISEIEPAITSNDRLANNSYFIGKCLLSRHDPRSRSYFWRSIKRNPRQLPSWIGLLYSTVFCRRQR